MKTVAAGQDKIDWQHLLEGKITGHFRGMQQLYLRSRPSRINRDDWIKQFIYRLIRISHTQWIFRNLTLHDRQHGHLAQLRRNTLAEELEQLHSLSPEYVPKESRVLLDFDINDLAEGDISAQEHWILAMQAARKAGMRAQGHRVRWASLPKRHRRCHDPPTRPFHSLSLEAIIAKEVFGDLTASSAKRRPSEASLSLEEPSNKRRRRRKKDGKDTLIQIHRSS